MRKYLYPGAVSLAVAAFALGSGGCSSSSSDKGPLGTYPGNTNRATLTTDNAKWLVEQPIWLVETYGGMVETIPSLFGMTEGELEAFGDTVTVSGTGNEERYEGSIAFNGFTPPDPEADVRIESGTFSAVARNFGQVVPEQWTWAKFTLDGLVVEHETSGDAFTTTYGGEVVFEWTSDTSNELTMTADAAWDGDDESDGGVYRMDRVTLARDFSEGESLTGRYYDPEYGYVDISTPNPIVGGIGTVRFEGANGELVLQFDGNQIYVHGYFDDEEYEYLATVTK